MTTEELAHHLDAASKRYIAKNNIQLYTIDGRATLINPCYIRMKSLLLKDNSAAGSFHE